MGYQSLYTSNNISTHQHTHVNQTFIYFCYDSDLPFLLAIGNLILREITKNYDYADKG